MAHSSESYETCLSEFAQDSSGCVVGSIESGVTIGKLVKSDVPSDSEAHAKQGAAGEEKHADVVHNHFQVLPDSPTVEIANSDVSGEIIPPLGHVHNYYSDPESDQEFEDDDNDDNDDMNDPHALANRIRLLIQTLASRSRPMPDVDCSSTPQIPERIVRDSVTGQPVPFADAAFLSDMELIAKLKNGLIMNGMKIAPLSGTGRSEPVFAMTEVEKKSVWAVLDSFKAPPAHHWCADLPEHLARIGNADGLDTLQSSSSPTTIISDDSSVMMCFPLIPVPDSKVELAKSSVVSISPVGNERPRLKKALKKYRMYVTFGKNVDIGNVEGSRSWKFWKKKGTLPRGASSFLGVAPEDRPTLTSRSLPSLSPRPDLPSKANVKQRVWMPSTTSMSVQALWWGYRIFLPPPVLSILSDEEVEATKRVALITAALTWFFDNIPVAALPQPMQPAIIMLQKLLPYLGYIGTFISWSWDSVKSFDTGHGVILSTTWLLPVALIPGTWEGDDFPVQPENPVEDQLSLNEAEQDRKLEYPLRLPLPLSSTSLSSTSLASSRSGFVTVPSASSTTPVDRGSPMPISPLSTLIAASSVVVATHSKSQVSIAPEATSTPSSGLDSRTVSTVKNDQEASHPSLEPSVVSPPASTATDPGMTTQPSFPTTTDRTDEGPEKTVSSEVSQRPAEERASQSSSLLMMSPTTLHAATRASQMVQILNESEGEAEKDEQQEKSEVKDAEAETAENAEQDTKPGEDKNVEAEKVESFENILFGDLPANKRMDSHVKTSATNVEADAAGNEAQTVVCVQRAPSTLAEVLDIESRVRETMMKNNQVTDGVGIEKVVRRSASASTAKTEKENVPLPSVSAATPIAPTSSKSKLAGSSGANAGGYSHSQITKVDGDKKEKRKSRGMTLVGGLWRLLTGSG